MRILDDAEQIAEWIDDRGHQDSIAYVLNRSVLFRARREQVFEGCMGVLDTPVGQ